MDDRPVINEGKTKIILDNGDGTVDVVNKDAITAGDGAKRDSFEGKGVASTRITCNVFELLERRGVPTHFIKQVDDRTFRAKKVEMIPLECVCRRVLSGSWLKRHPDAFEGTVLAEMTFELFEKKDEDNDPLLVPRYVQADGLWVIDRYHADQPLSVGTWGEYPDELMRSWITRQNKIEYLARQTFEIIEESLSEIEIDGQRLVFIDGKAELGITTEGRLVLADVIDNDSWRVWKGGKKEGQVDKQAYRDLDGQVMSPEERTSIKALFEQVAVATDAFGDM